MGSKKVMWHSKEMMKGACLKSKAGPAIRKRRLYRMYCVFNFQVRGGGIKLLLGTALIPQSEAGLLQPK